MQPSSNLGSCQDAKCLRHDTTRLIITKCLLSMRSNSRVQKFMRQGSECLTRSAVLKPQGILKGERNRHHASRKLATLWPPLFWVADGLDKSAFMLDLETCTPALHSQTMERECFKHSNYKIIYYITLYRAIYYTILYHIIPY